jgi:uncharacterized membrane protein YedE/YeeE
MMVRAWAPFLSGLLFAVGLAVSRMTDPGKVIAFLDFSGDWDPSLALVMVAAVSVHFVALRRRKRGVTATAADDFALPAAGRVTPRFLVGAAVFGVGWGLAGYCPGPAIVAVASGALPAVVSFGSMLLGTGLHELVFGVRGSQVAAPTCGGADLV